MGSSSILLHNRWDGCYLKDFRKNLPWETTTFILRIFQHTPGTYPNDPLSSPFPTVYGSEFLNHLGKPGEAVWVCETGVCWGSLRFIFDGL